MDLESGLLEVCQQEILISEHFWLAKIFGQRKSLDHIFSSWAIIKLHTKFQLHMTLAKTFYLIEIF